MDLQQRGIEFTQLFGTYKNLRPPLLEKMPPMQISRISSQNGESSGSYDDNSPDLIENGIGIGEDQLGKESNMNMMGDNTVSQVKLFKITLKKYFIYCYISTTLEYIARFTWWQRFNHTHRHRFIQLGCRSKEEFKEC